VGACLSPTGAFQALSFVNGVATPRAGTHVTHVCTPLLQALAPALSRALKLPAGEELTTARPRLREAPATTRPPLSGMAIAGASF
jgi:DNA gyrase/topoisomerase IV subunit B